MEESKRLEGQVVIITGGAGGIGRATCFETMRRGARAVVVDVDQVQVDAVVAELELELPGNGATGLVADVRREQDIEAMVAQVLESYGRIDLLVNCAGILRVKGSGPKFLHQMSLQEWDAVIDTNLKGTFLCNRAVLPTMIKQRSGQIINISSTSGVKGRAFDSAYCASKFGMIGLSEALAEEVRAYGIRVHVIMPDAVDTAIWEQNAPVQAPEDSLSPQRVANLITYLALLPVDTVLDHLILRPFKTRRRKKKKAKKRNA